MFLCRNPTLTVSQDYENLSCISLWVREVCAAVHKLCDCNVILIFGRKDRSFANIEVSPSQVRRVNKTSLFHPSLDVIRKGYHAYRLPDTKGNTRSDTTVKTLDTVLPVNERKSVENRQLSGSVRVGSSLGHGLHLEVN